MINWKKLSDSIVYYNNESAGRRDKTFLPFFCLKERCWIKDIKKLILRKEMKVNAGFGNYNDNYWLWN